MKTCSSAICIAYALLSSFALGQANFPPGPFVLDDFEDELFNDNSPISWRRGVWEPGAQESGENGDLVIRSTGVSFFGLRDPANEWYGYGDATIQTQARIVAAEDGGVGAGLLGRSPDLRTYFMELLADGRFLVGETFPNGPANVYADITTNLDVVNNDVILRYDLDGDEMRAWAWYADDPQPTAPLFTFTDPTLTYGTVGVFTDSLNSTPGAVAYRWFEVSEVIPEPSTVLLFGLGLASTLTARRVR